MNISTGQQGFHAPAISAKAIIMNLRTRYFSNLLLLSILINTPVFSQWNTNPSLNTAACVQPNDQQEVRMVSDGQHGAIMVWTDYRNDATQTVADVYAQRIDKSGYNSWATNGVAICTHAADQTTPVLVEDGNGGAIITWTDARNGNRDIYAQRIDSTGNVLWTANGVAVVAKPNAQQDPHLVSDGAGGAIVAWQDSANGFWDIYAQRINNNGTTLWTTTGVPVCTAILSQINERMTSNGAGGAILTWQDYRNTNDYDIYAQCIDSSGMVQWTANGVAICTSADTQNNPKIKAPIKVPIQAYAFNLKKVKLLDGSPFKKAMDLEGRPVYWWDTRRPKSVDDLFTPKEISR